MTEDNPKHADVLIAGAGPAGLMLAVQLLRHGIYPYIIDNQEPDENQIKEPVLLQPRTFEYFRQLGLLNDLLDRKATFYSGGAQIGGKKPFRLPLTVPEDVPCDIHSQAMCSYHTIGKSLVDWLTDHACPVHWRTDIIQESQDDRGVRVTLTEAGRPFYLSCQWLVHTLPTGNTSRLMNQRTLFVGEGINRRVPPQGQSVNTDMQDAINLGWKLAHVVNGRASRELLNSYIAERSNIRQEILALDKRSILVWPEPVIGGRLAAWIRYEFFKCRLKSPAYVRHLRGVATQLALHYRNSPLTAHHSLGRNIRSGDRLPFLSVFDEKTKANTNLHDWCSKPGFVLLLLGTLPANSLFIMGQWVRQAFPRIMHLYYLPYSPANDTVFRAFETKPGNTKMILVRPDMYIGYMNDTIGANLIGTYMQEIIKYDRRKE